MRGYSLGMRQRLGIAIALLKDPELLILDEPANGLDPAGIREVRELMRRLGAEGRTVFLSSHLLGEVEQVCDEVAIVAPAAPSPMAPWPTCSPGPDRPRCGSRSATSGPGPRRWCGPALAVAEGERLRVDVALEKAELVTRALWPTVTIRPSCVRWRPASRTPSSP